MATSTDTTGNSSTLGTRYPTEGSEAGPPKNLSGCLTVNRHRERRMCLDSQCGHRKSHEGGRSSGKVTYELF